MLNSDWKWTRRLTMIICPLLLVMLEWTHPSGFSKHVFNGLMPMADWWKNLHIYQAFLFGGIAVGAAFLTWKINTFLGTLSKGLIWLFAVSYLLFDSTAGIVVGFILESYTKNPQLDKETVQTLVQLLYNDPIIGGTSSLFSLMGSWSWLLGIITAIIALFFQNQALPLWKRLPPIILLACSAYSLYIGHYAPYGPIAFGCFAAASLWFEWFQFGPAHPKEQHTP